jgi:hypothetical protein
MAFTVVCSSARSDSYIPSRSHSLFHGGMWLCRERRAPQISSGGHREHARMARSLGASWVVCSRDGYDRQCECRIYLAFAAMALARRTSAASSWCSPDSLDEGDLALSVANRSQLALRLLHIPALQPCALFAFRGAVVAGQMGMSLTLTNALLVCRDFMGQHQVCSVRSVDCAQGVLAP